MYKLLLIFGISISSFPCWTQAPSKIVNASDGISSEQVKVLWDYQKSTEGIYIIYRSTCPSYIGEKIKDSKYHSLLDRKATPGKIYYYTVYLKSSTSKIIEVGKDSGYKKRLDYVFETQEDITATDMLDSGNGKINLDSLILLSTNSETADNIQFAYSLNNFTSDTLPAIELKFWLSKDTISGTSENLIVALHLDEYPPKSSIREEVTASLPNNIESGNYYLIGQAILEGEILNQIVKEVAIE